MKNEEFFFFRLFFMHFGRSGNRKFRIGGPLTANLYYFFALNLLDISTIHRILLAVRGKNVDVSVLVYLMDFSCS